MPQKSPQRDASRALHGSRRPAAPYPRPQGGPASPGAGTLAHAPCEGPAQRLAHSTRQLKGKGNVLSRTGFQPSLKGWWDQSFAKQPSRQLRGGGQRQSERREEPATGDPRAGRGHASFAGAGVASRIINASPPVATSCSFVLLTESQRLAFSLWKGDLSLFSSYLPRSRLPFPALRLPLLRSLPRK